MNDPTPDIAYLPDPPRLLIAGPNRGVLVAVLLSGRRLEDELATALEDWRAAQGGEGMEASAAALDRVSVVAELLELRREASRVWSAGESASTPLLWHAVVASSAPRPSKVPRGTPVRPGPSPPNESPQSPIVNTTGAQPTTASAADGTVRGDGLGVRDVETITEAADELERLTALLGWRAPTSP